VKNKDYSVTLERCLLKQLWN